MAEEDEEEITEDKLRVKPKSLPVSALCDYSYIRRGAWAPRSTATSTRRVRQELFPYLIAFFKRPLDYNQKLHRDDREHAKSVGLKVNEEEWARPVGVLTSSIYGRQIYKPVEEMNREHVRVNHLKVDFYRKNAITCMEEPGFGHIAPS